MPFSLYGDLPEPSSEKPDPTKKTPNNSSGGSGFSSLYASLPAPGGKGDPPSTTTVAAPDATVPIAATSSKPTPSESPAPKPAGWSTFGHFRPVMRKPTIQAKPKLNRAVIPAGATVISTTKVNKSAQGQEPALAPPPATGGVKAVMDTPLAPLSRRVDASYYSVNDDVNGFRAAQQAKKKGKNKKQQQEPVMFDLNEDYDPHRPNDYELYKEDRKQHKEEMKRRQEEERRRQRRERERSLSPYSSDGSRSRSRSRSTSTSRSRSRSRSGSPRRAAFAPPPNLYGRRSSSPPPSPPRRFQRSPSPSSPSPPQHQSNLPIHLTESADDAYMRRMRMSTQRTTPTQQADDRVTDDDGIQPAFGLGSGPDMARKVMTKFGWQEGQGLGRDEDGIREALKVQATGRGAGVILHTGNDPVDPSPQQSPLAATPTLPQVPISPVVLLTNMVGPGEVDDMLQQETAEECAKYGKVERCLIFEVPGGQVAEDQAVRIFVKFSAAESAIAAVNDLDGRYFGGRVVTAKYYDCARFDRLDLAPGPDEDFVR